MKFLIERSYGDDEPHKDAVKIKFKNTMYPESPTRYIEEWVIEIKTLKELEELKKGIKEPLLIGYSEVYKMPTLEIFTGFLEY